tara:strand:- start:88 stop:672 length:585 start_codon:yes stop_codon:yes gene_type:complete
MKNLKYYLSTILFLTLIISCSKESITVPADESADVPDEIKEEEVITTMTITLTPTSGSTAVVTLQTQDLDGDGPNAPEVTVSGNLTAGVVYSGDMEWLNELVSPAEVVTEEIEEKDLDHQVFYTPAGGLDVTIEYANNDSAGNPLGTEFTLTANTASSGSLTFTLVHEPTKPNTGLEDAGGEIDIETAFNITIE